MILYFSSCIPDKHFTAAFTEGDITSGHQAQKFNHLLITGLARHTAVTALANPPFNKKKKSVIIKNDNVKYCVSGGSNYGFSRKIMNVFYMLRYAIKASHDEKPAVVIVDAINLGALISAKLYAIIKKIPSIAVITDVPEIMGGYRSGTTLKLTAWLMKRMDGYVLLTEAMNNLVNPKKKPFIVMEGLCETEGDISPKPTTGPSFRKTCLFTGTIGVTCGVDRLIEAFKAEELSNVDLYLYGIWKLRETPETLLDGCSNIYYCGVADNDTVVKKQRMADLLINPRPSDVSYGEYSFPSKLMEYMASGTAVLTTKLPGIPKEYYNYVYSIADESPRGIADAVLDSLNNTEDRGKIAQEFVFTKKNKYEQTHRIVKLGLSIHRSKHSAGGNDEK